MLPGAEFRIEQISGQVVWPCVENANGSLKVSLHSNSAMAWDVKASGATTPYYPLAPSVASALALAVQMNTTSSDVIGSVLPGSTAMFEVDESELPVTIYLDGSPALQMIYTLTLSATFIPGVAALDKIAAGECIVDGLSYLGDMKDISKLSSTILGCLGTAIKGAGGVALSMIASGPAAMMGMMEGLFGEFADGNDIYFDISHNPVGHAQGVLPQGFEGTWQGPATGYQDWYDVEVTLAQKGDQIAGSIEYPGLDCGGRLTYRGMQGKTVLMDEEITFGTQSCTILGDVRIWRDGDNLRFKYNRLNDDRRFIYSDMTKQ